MNNWGDSNNILIKIVNFSFHYNNSLKSSLNNINLEISKGEFILITGKSGCGKTTLIRTFNGLVPHFYGGIIKGNVKVFGINPISCNVKDFGGKIGYVFQNPDNQLIMSNVERELAFGMENLLINRADMIQRIDRILKLMNIEHLKNREISSLSGGEKQKIAIASILCLEPEIIVLDEPTSELDPQSANDILDLIVKIHNELNITIVITEHRLERLIHEVNRLIIMEDGQIKKDGSPRTVLKDSKNVNFSFAILRLYEKIIQKSNESLDQRDLVLPLTLDEAETFCKLVFNSISLSEAKTYFNFNLNPNHSNNEENIIEIKNVCFDYKAKLGALQNICITIKKEEFVGIIGENGSGKTTLLKLLMGLINPKTGTITIEGSDISKKSIAKLSKTVGLMFQNPGIQFYRDTLRKEYKAIVNNYIEDTKDIELRISEMLEFFNLGDYAETYPKYLSMGELQKAALGSVLISRPKILTLDEPTHGMDYLQKKHFFDFLDEYRKLGNTVIVVSHDIELLSKYAKRIIILENGKIIADGETHKILSEFDKFSPTINRLIKYFPFLPQEILNEDELVEVMFHEKK